MALSFRKAQRKRVHLKIGITAPSGHGKTFSSLLLAKSLAGS
jgi:pantothenate kinase-related protein Tda10